MTGADEEKNWKLSGHLTCTNEKKMASNIMFFCKQKKNGDALWKFKGNPDWMDSNPGKIKCIKARPST